MDFPDGAGLVGESGFEFGEVGLRLLAGLGLEAPLEPGRRVRPDRAETVRHRRVAAFVAALPDLPEQPASGQIRAVPDLVGEIALVRLREPRPRLPRRIGRSREAPVQKLADRLAVQARPARDRADRKAFPFQFLQHGNLLQQLYLEVVKIRVESRRDRVVEGSCGVCLFKAAPGPIRPLPMMNPDIVPDFCLFGSFARFSFSAARRAWKACGQSLFALFSGFGLWAWIAHILPTLPLVGVAFVNWRFGFAAARRAWKAVDNPYLRCVRVSGSGPGLTTLPTLSAVGGRSRFGAFHSATALRGFFI